MTSLTTKDTSNHGEKEDDNHDHNENKIRKRMMKKKMKKKMRKRNEEPRAGMERTSAKTVAAWRA